MGPARCETWDTPSTWHLVVGLPPHLDARLFSALMIARCVTFHELADSMLGLDEVFSREQLNRLPGRGLAPEEQRRSYRRVPASRLGRPTPERVMVEKQLITQEQLAVLFSRDDEATCAADPGRR